MSIALLAASFAGALVPALPTPDAGAPGAAVDPSASSLVLERISTAVTFPRGLVILDEKLYALCRGRVREYGGVTAAIDDQAGTIYEVDPTVAEPFHAGEASEAVQKNGRVLAEPTAPPFRLWDRTANPPSSDRVTDRPYCGLRYDEASRNFYICAFSGIDKAEDKNQKTFSKNLSDALMRFDTRTGKWHDVERHDIEAGGIYPHHDPARRPPPHGWLNGPDNCLAVGHWLYAVAKDNNRLVRYDLRPIVADPESGPPPSEFVLDENIRTRGVGPAKYYGHSMLAHRDGWLYVGFRTSSEIVRIRLDAEGSPVQPIEAELLARFAPYDPETKKSANLTDMSFGPDGALYVISASPARVFRFQPDPKAVYDACDPKTRPFADLAELTGNPKMKSENILVDDAGRVYVTSGDSYAYHHGAGGVIWRLSPRGS